MLIDQDSGILLRTIDSTNTYCKKKEVPIGYWVLADEQTAGRGRHGRVWLSQGDEKIFFSAKFTLDKLESSISILSLLIGSAVLKTLQNYFPEQKNQLSLKWPNDIYLGNKKVSGILIESESIEEKTVFIAGIGINLYGKEKLETSDYVSQKPIGKDFKQKLIFSLIAYINEIEWILQNTNLLSNEIQWIYENSLLKNKKIETTDNGRNLSGIVTGYDRNGFLIVKITDGNLVSLMDTGPDFKVGL
ncbi:MAG TPA: biotin--[acetyl-CoA-carboxylase] ligase [Leptospiraceae bacterium]|nr:biotin--[acetyl-CoA-carboxylase] ligase [Leptospiraceae bacterium]